MTKTKPQNPTGSEEKKYAVYYSIGPKTELVGIYKTLEEAVKARKNFGYRMHEKMKQAENRALYFEEVPHGEERIG